MVCYLASIAFFISKILFISRYEVAPVGPCAEIGYLASFRAKWFEDVVTQSCLTPALRAFDFL